MQEVKLRGHYIKQWKAMTINAQSEIKRPLYEIMKSNDNAWSGIKIA